MEAQLTFGEAMRRLRREKNWNLQKLSHETGLSYSHLSRVENDSTVPKAETVTKIAEALGGDLKQMLELADCLPRQILDRIMDRQQGAAGPVLRRAVGGRSGEQASGVPIEVLSVAQSSGLPTDQAEVAARAIAMFLDMGPQHRRAVATLIEQLHDEENTGDH